MVAEELQWGTADYTRFEDGAPFDYVIGSDIVYPHETGSSEAFPALLRTLCDAARLNRAGKKDAAVALIHHAKRGGSGEFSFFEETVPPYFHIDCIGAMATRGAAQAAAGETRPTVGVTAPGSGSLDGGDERCTCICGFKWTDSIRVVIVPEAFEPFPRESVLAEGSGGESEGGADIKGADIKGADIKGGDIKGGRPSIDAALQESVAAKGAPSSIVQRLLLKFKSHAGLGDAEMLPQHAGGTTVPAPATGSEEKDVGRGDAHSRYGGEVVAAAAAVAESKQLTEEEMEVLGMPDFSSASEDDDDDEIAGDSMPSILAPPAVNGGTKGQERGATNPLAMFDALEGLHSVYTLMLKQ